MCSMYRHARAGLAVQEKEAAAEEEAAAAVEEVGRASSVPPACREPRRAAGTTRARLCVACEFARSSAKSNSSCMRHASAGIATSEWMEARKLAHS